MFLKCLNLPKRLKYFISLNIINNISLFSIVLNDKGLRKKCMPIKTKYVQLQNFLTLVVENDTVISGINSVRKVKSNNQIIVCFLRVKSNSNCIVKNLF